TAPAQSTPSPATAVQRSAACWSTAIPTDPERVLRKLRNSGALTIGCPASPCSRSLQAIFPGNLRVVCTLSHRRAVGWSTLPISGGRDLESARGGLGPSNIGVANDSVLKPV